MIVKRTYLPSINALACSKTKADDKIETICL